MVAHTEFLLGARCWSKGLILTPTVQGGRYRDDATLQRWTWRSERLSQNSKVVMLGLPRRLAPNPPLLCRREQGSSGEVGGPQWPGWVVARRRRAAEARMGGPLKAILRSWGFP